MIRKKLGTIALFLMFALVIGSGSVFWALFQVPDFYEDMLRDEPDPEVRQQAAKQFVERTRHFVEELEYADTWSEEFTQTQVNSWLAEELHQYYSDWLPPGVSDPRVRFNEDVIRIGFRYENARFNGVVSLRLRPWVEEPNQLAVEVQSIRAGLLPIPPEDVLKDLSRQFAAGGWSVERGEVDGSDVVFVYLSQEKIQQAVLEVVEVTDGTLKIAGSRSTASGAVANEIDFPRLVKQFRENAERSRQQ